MFFEVSPTRGPFWSYKKRNFWSSAHAVMQQNQRFHWALMSRLYLTMIVFELHFELGNFLFKAIWLPEKNLVPPSHFHPLWNICIAEAAPGQKWYGLCTFIQFFFWAQMWNQNLLRSLEVLRGWLRVFWNLDTNDLERMKEGKLRRCNRFRRIPFSTVKFPRPKFKAQ